MNCPICGRPAAADDRFCAGCGRRLAMACPSCGLPLAADARFCPSCGSPAPAVQPAEAAGEPHAPGAATPGVESGAQIAAGAGPDAPGLAGGAGLGAGRSRERKVATILFADLVGFTSLGEENDPEFVEALVSRAFERLRAEALRYEGTIEKFAGDAMLVVFGVPAAHEDDSERAVRAALEMQTAMAALAAELRSEGAPELSLRIGIEAGEVLVDLARVESERDRMVTGDAVTTAARFQQAASPGAVVVGPAAYAATRDVVEYLELPPASLKGKAVPVPAWQAVAVKARRGGLRAPLGLEAPLVGRDEEIALLKETVRRTVAEGRPHLVTVLGSAGVGKSRLAWELEKYLDGLPEDFTWRKGRCLAYAQVSYSALADVAKADARVLDDDAPASALAKVEARLAELAGGRVDEGILAALRAVLALGAPDRFTRDELFDAWRRYLEMLARDAPLVLVLEDIHWADEGLLDFVEFLARWGEGPVMLLCLARHELLERRPSWGGGIPNASSIVLEPLEPAENEQLVDGLLGPEVAPDLRDHVVSLAEGNPLFTEELVRMFVDQGVLRFADGAWQLARPVAMGEVPGSIRAVLAARLDGLAAPEKRAAQDAAVVGRIFWDAALAHMSRQGTSATSEVLRRLRVKELVVPRVPSALAGAAEFGFRHVLIRDVAYDSLPKRERASRHLDVARWAEEELAERRDEMVELLASHYLSALRYEEELGTGPGARLDELRRRTYAYARRACERAYGLAQLEIALGWGRVAVEQARLLELPAGEQAALAFEFMATVGNNEEPQRGVEIAAHALAVLREAGPATPGAEELEARLTAYLARHLFFAGRIDESRTVLRTAIATLEPGPPSAGRAFLLGHLGWTYWRAGPIEEARPILERALAEARATGASDAERWACHDLGVTVAFLGRAADGVALIRESLRLATEAGDHQLVMRCHVNLPALMEGNGDPWAERVRLEEEGLALARRGVDRASIAWIAGNLSDTLELVGRIREAVELSTESIDNALAVGDAFCAGFQLVGRARLFRLLGQLDAARADVARARQVLTGEAASESQLRPQWLVWDALERWPEDPAGAVDLLATAMGETVGDTVAGELLARMALRARRPAIVREAAEAVERASRGSTGPAWALRVRYVRALAEPDPGTAVAAQAACAREAEEQAYLLPAADAWADAALAAARAGVDASEALVRAKALYAACEVKPLLGDLPEIRFGGAPPAS